MIACTWYEKLLVCIIFGIALTMTCGAILESDMKTYQKVLTIVMVVAAAAFVALGVII